VLGVYASASRISSAFYTLRTDCKFYGISAVRSGSLHARQTKSKTNGIARSHLAFRRLHSLQSWSAEPRDRLPARRSCGWRDPDELPPVDVDAMCWALIRTGADAVFRANLRARHEARGRRRDMEPVSGLGWARRRIRQLVEGHCAPESINWLSSYAT
jgi:hypothetical protein